MEGGRERPEERSSRQRRRLPPNSEDSAIDCHPKREREGGRSDRVCRPNVFAATDDNDDDVSIANFHLAFPPSLRPSLAPELSPTPPPFAFFLPSGMDVAAPAAKQLFTVARRFSSLRSAAAAAVAGEKEGRKAAARAAVVVWSQSRLLLFTCACACATECVSTSRRTRNMRGGRRAGESLCITMMLMSGVAQPA